MFTLRFDMRAPDWAGPAADLYGAAIDMCAWAERAARRSLCYPRPRRRRRPSARAADVGLGDRGADAHAGDTAGRRGDSVVGPGPARRRDERAGPDQPGTGVVRVRRRTPT